MGYGTMNTTRAKNIFNEVNLWFFENELKPVNFIKFGRHGNKFDFWPYNIPTDGFYWRGTIYYHKKLSFHDAVGTIAHEMIHHYQATILNLDLDNMTDAEAHGATFQPLAEQMKEQGYNI